MTGKRETGNDIALSGEGKREPSPYWFDETEDGRLDGGLIALGQNTLGGIIWVCYTRIGLR